MNKKCVFDNLTKCEYTAGKCDAKINNKNIDLIPYGNDLCCIEFRRNIFGKNKIRISRLYRINANGTRIQLNKRTLGDSKLNLEFIFFNKSQVR